MDTEHLWGEGPGAQEADRSRRGPSWVGVTLALLAVAYLASAAHGLLVVVGDLVSWAGEGVLRFPGSAPSSGGAELREDLLAATVRTTCLAAVGAALGWWQRHRVVVAVSGCGVVVALVVGLGAYALAAPDRPAPPPEDHPVCQEHSGGDNRCPGG